MDKIRNLKDRLKHISLSKKLTLHIIASFIAALFVGLAMFNITTLFIDNYYNDYERWDAISNEKANELQNYITENDISLANVDILDEWCKHNSRFYIDIYDGEELIYTSPRFGVAFSEDVVTTLEFSDGTAELVICNFLDTRYSYFATTVDFAIAIILFIFLVLHRIRRIVHEIDRIQRDITILKSGGLEHEIKVNSSDELGALEQNLDDMRIALKNNIEREETLSKANNDLVTRMSHDLRTPLTSLLLYLDLITKKKYSDEEELDKYIHISKSKAEQIKNMSELLFERFLVTGDSDNIEFQDISTKYALEDPLSALVMTLEVHGILTYTDINWPDRKIHIAPKYLDRILDNIYSNMIKYSDTSKPVVISVYERTDGFVCISLINHVGLRRSAESSGIGVENIRIMMEKMGGTYSSLEEDGKYETRLGFKVIS